MKRVLLIVLVVVLTTFAGYRVYISLQTSVMSELMLANIEALASGEGNDCHYINGYVAFTGRKGGAYDCCRIWVNKRPNEIEGHCH